MRNIKLTKTNEVEEMDSRMDLVIENENLQEGDAKEFNALVSEAYSKMIAAEDFGGWTEFYDEDGLVLMTATEESNNTILFTFGQDLEFKFNKQGFDPVAVG